MKTGGATYSCSPLWMVKVEMRVELGGIWGRHQLNAALKKREAGVFGWFWGDKNSDSWNIICDNREQQSVHQC